MADGEVAINDVEEFRIEDSNHKIPNTDLRIVDNKAEDSRSILRGLARLGTHLPRRRRENTPVTENLGLIDSEVEAVEQRPEDMTVEAPRLADKDVEASDTKELEPSRVVTAELPVTAGHVDVEVLYQQEADNVRAERFIPEKDFRDLEKRVEAEKSRYNTEQEKTQPKRTFTVQDRLRHKALAIEARARGVKDPKQFQTLVDYLETTLTEERGAYQRHRKGLSDDEKAVIIEKWRAKGYHASASDFHESDKYSWISPRQQVPFNVTRRDIPALTPLISADGNPVEVISALRGANMYFRYHTIRNPTEISQIARLEAAPHLQEAMTLLDTVPNWSHQWFSSGRTDTPDQLAGLIRLAEDPEVAEKFPPEFVEKMNVLSTAMHREVIVSEFEDYRRLINNPEQFELLVTLINTNQTPDSMREVPVFEPMAALDEAGLAQPLLTITSAGIRIDRQIFPKGKNYSSEPTKNQGEIVEDLRALVAKPELQAIIQDPEQQNFAALLAKLRQKRLSPDELQDFEKLYGQKEDVIYLMELVYGNQDLHGYYGRYMDPLKGVEPILNHPELVSTFKSGDFVHFLQDLQSKTGYKPYPSDFSGTVYDGGRGRYGSRLERVFADEEMRSGLLSDETVATIQAIGTESNLDLMWPEKYVKLGSIPGAVEAIAALKGISCKISHDFNSFPDVKVVAKIAASPDLIAKLSSDQTRDFVARISETYPCKVSQFDAVALAALTEDENAPQLFSDETKAFIEKVRPHGVSVRELKPLVDLDTEIKNLIVELTDKLSYYPEFTWGTSRLVGEEALQEVANNPVLRARILSNDVTQLVKTLRSEHNFRLYPSHMADLANAPENFLTVLGDLKEKHNYAFSSEHIQVVSDIANNYEGFTDTLHILGESGYTFQSSDITLLSKLSQNIEATKEQIDIVRQDFPDFQFALMSSAGEPYTPYEVLIQQRFADINSLPQAVAYLDKIPEEYLEKARLLVFDTVVKEIKKADLAVGPQVVEVIFDYLHTHELGEAKVGLYDSLVKAAGKFYTKEESFEDTVYYANARYSVPKRYFDEEIDTIVQQGSDSQKFAHVYGFTEIYRHDLNPLPYEANIQLALAERQHALALFNAIEDPRLKEIAAIRAFEYLLDDDLGDVSLSADFLSNITDPDLHQHLQEIALQTRERAESGKPKYYEALERVKKISPISRDALVKSSGYADDEDKIRELEEEVEKVRETQSVSINISLANIRNFLAGGRYMSTWENYAREGGYFFKRDEVERQMGIRAKGTEKDPHPIYGAVWAVNGRDEKYGGAGTSRYGECFMLLKNDHIQDRMTSTYEDSFDGHTTQMLTWEDAAYAKAILNKVNGKYVESQVLGGVTVDDVQSINIRGEIDEADIEALRQQYPNIDFKKVEE